MRDDCRAYHYREAVQGSRSATHLSGVVTPVVEVALLSPTSSQAVSPQAMVPVPRDAQREREILIASLLTVYLAKLSERWSILSFIVVPLNQYWLGEGEECWPVVLSFQSS